jgi:hypothetical protein
LKQCPVRNKFKKEKTLLLRTLKHVRRQFGFTNVYGEHGEHGYITVNGELLSFR